MSERSFIEEAHALVSVNGRARDYLRMLDDAAEIAKGPNESAKAVAQNFVEKALANLRAAVDGANDELGREGELMEILRDCRDAMHHAIESPGQVDFAALVNGIDAAIEAVSR